MTVSTCFIRWEYAIVKPDCRLEWSLEGKRKQANALLNSVLSSFGDHFRLGRPEMRQKKGHP